jgi:L-amino acid N-acyltransferase YncA
MPRSQAGGSGAPVSDRCAYAGVVEHPVYVHPGTRGQGIGAVLLNTLTASTEAAGIWTIQSGIFPENTASLALHDRAGFRRVGVRRVASGNGSASITDGGATSSWSNDAPPS